jgi:hypothetical protein
MLSQSYHNFIPLLLLESLLQPITRELLATKLHTCANPPILGWLSGAEDGGELGAYGMVVSKGITANYPVLSQIHRRDDSM